jgi:tRNA1Val (adenine37-N6)-methyltransferase
MRVGSDAVLLGAWANFEKNTGILEIGTGCGVIALMAAQRSVARIDAIDIDLPSIQEADLNFRESQWKGRLFAIHSSLQEFTSTCKIRYDHIIANPPYFRNSLKSTERRKNTTRHETSLGFEELLDGVTHLLARAGKASFILPCKEHSEFTKLASLRNLHLSRQMEIIPKYGKAPNRLLTEFTFLHGMPVESAKLTIRNNDESYTSEYLDFTGPYYFSLK